ncbi:unnamed protein product [Mycena citricolor]|uniref:Uncharacterized protein n=1 Tax=Mycena citricolor TaxID=2018698 RepID=A0AAD2HW75_9AGAR|nr:unnamed protein product [Mycena citricolor]
MQAFQIHDSSAQWEPFFLTTIAVCCDVDIPTLILSKTAQCARRAELYSDSDEIIPTVATAAASNPPFYRAPQAYRFPTGASYHVGCWPPRAGGAEDPEPQTSVWESDSDNSDEESDAFGSSTNSGIGRKSTGGSSSSAPSRCTSPPSDADLVVSASKSVQGLSADSKAFARFLDLLVRSNAGRIGISKPKGWARLRPLAPTPLNLWWIH